MQFFKDKNNRVGLIGTVLIHSLLLILFLFVGMSYPDPPPPEEGITINFGDSEEGMGEIQSNELSSNSSPTSEETVESTTSNVAPENSMTTQNTTETVNVNATTQTNNNTQQNVQPEKQTTSQNLSEALNAFNNSGSSSTSDGVTGNPGNQGSLNGNPNSNNYYGGGNGNGIRVSLAGRTPISLPKIEDNSQERGEIVVDIVVDKFGKVIKATAGARGSTITNPALNKKAEEAALKTKFNTNLELSTDQRGKMTFIFILN